MNSYERSEVLNVGNAHEVILGEKVEVRDSADFELGLGYFTKPNDIDESDE